MIRLRVQIIGEFCECSIVPLGFISQLIAQSVNYITNLQNKYLIIKYQSNTKLWIIKLCPNVWLNINVVSC